MVASRAAKKARAHATLGLVTSNRRQTESFRLASHPACSHDQEALPFVSRMSALPELTGAFAGRCVAHEKTPTPNLLCSTQEQEPGV
jgi:hypothetical protein